jgi:hypothetical protein
MKEQEQTTEEFRDVPGYEGLYKVSNLGNVYSIKKEKLLKLTIGFNKRYYRVRIINRDLKYTTIEVHKLMAMAFLNHERSRYNLVVNHINNDGLDNRLENLEVISHRQNLSSGRKDRETMSSKYTGVDLKKNNRYVSQIKVNKKYYYLGSFSNELKAKNRYDEALKYIDSDFEEWYKTLPIKKRNK